MHTIRNVLQRRDLVWSGPEDSVYRAAARMHDAHIGCLAIISGDSLVGVFSERDLMTRVVVPGLDPSATRLSGVMTRNVVTAVIGDSRETALEKMRRAGCRHLPIVEDGRVISMLSMRDLLRDEIEEKGEEIRHLRAYLHQTPVQ